MILFFGFGGLGGATTRLDALFHGCEGLEVFGRLVAMAVFVVANIAVRFLHGGHGGWCGCDRCSGGCCRGCDWCGRRCWLGRDGGWHHSLDSFGGGLGGRLCHGSGHRGCGGLHGCCHRLCKRNGRSGDHGGSEEGIFEHDFSIERGKSATFNQRDRRSGR